MKTKTTNIPETSGKFQTTPIRSPPRMHSPQNNNRNNKLSRKKLTQKNSSNKHKMDMRILGMDSPLFSTLQHMMDIADETDKAAPNQPSRAYVRDAKAMAATPADIKEYTNSYQFIIDMPGLKSGDVKVQVEDEHVLVISGERKRELEEKEGAKYVRMERRVGKFMRKFVLPENVDTDKISAVCQDGVLTVKVEKLPPPQPKKPKTIQVEVA